MQTFMPYPNICRIARCLDYRRLGKQRVEAMQILNALQPDSKSRWRKHPIVSMWKGHENALKLYHNEMIAEWKRRGYKNNMKTFSVRGRITFPDWWGSRRLHSSHRAALLAKDFKHYSQFGWKEKPEISYIWL